MIVVLAVVLTGAALLFTLFIRQRDIPEPLPVSPFAHLEDRKAAIYENLRDLQFEYRLGKLSDADYQQTKLTLQKELAVVLAETEESAKRLGLTTKRVAPAAASAVASAAAASSAPKAALATVCPHCGAKFAKSMKYCGECGKAMA